jgi:adenosine deaminase CECR1
MNQGIPVVLSSDDPAMFNSMGLSFDFFQVTSSPWLSVYDTEHLSCFQVLAASEVTGLLTLGQMARDSITVSHELCLWACPLHWVTFFV